MNERKTKLGALYEYAILYRRLAPTHKSKIFKFTFDKICRFPDDSIFNRD